MKNVKKLYFFISLRKYCFLILTFINELRIFKNKYKNK